MNNHLHTAAYSLILLLAFSCQKEVIQIDKEEEYTPQKDTRPYKSPCEGCPEDENHILDSDTPESIVDPDEDEEHDIDEKNGALKLDDESKTNLGTTETKVEVKGGKESNHDGHEDVHERDKKLVAF